MKEKTISNPKARDPLANASKVLCHAPVTIFALPKPFVGDAVRIQRNAIRSWVSLGPAIDVLLMGDENGIAEFAAECGAAHIGTVRRNEFGTPLVSSAFEHAHLATTSPILVYCNADVILDDGFVQAMEQLSNQTLFENWLAIGRRLDLAVKAEIDFENASQVSRLIARSQTEGSEASAVCKEFFAFNRGLFQNVPPFAVGRGNWDNWMVANAKSKSVPVIDLSPTVLVMHQQHDYSHMTSSRLKCYVSGPEAKENQRLAGGRNIVSGTTRTHRLGSDGIKKIGSVEAGVDLIRDLPRLIRLTAQLLLS